MLSINIYIYMYKSAKVGDSLVDLTHQRVSCEKTTFVIVFKFPGDDSSLPALGSLVFIVFIFIGGAGSRVEKNREWCPLFQGGILASS